MRHEIKTRPQTGTKTALPRQNTVTTPGKSVRKVVFYNFIQAFWFGPGSIQTSGAFDPMSNPLFFHFTTVTTSDL